MLAFVLLFVAIVACQTEDRLPAVVTYTTWVGNDRPFKINTIGLFAQRNSSFYDLMEKAAEKRPNKFEFNVVEFTGLGRYVSAIGGVQENKTSNQYWMIYKLNSYPNPLNPPSDSQLSPVGIDLITVNNRDNFLWWYKTVG